MEPIGYLGNNTTFEEFFKRVSKLKEDTREARLQILKDLQKELRAIALNEQDLKNNLRGKKILHIKGDNE